LSANVKGMMTEKAIFAASPKREYAMFGAGCFWGVEDALRQVEGVLDVQVGYAGGHVDDPDYEVVCEGKTGHAEAVLIEFHPDIISYEELLEEFWDMHDPTTPNRQGPDVGDQYRSMIFYFGDEQKTKAESSKAARQEKHEDPIVTEITPAGDFWRAEEYHQRYLEKRRKMGIE